MSVRYPTERCLILRKETHFTIDCAFNVTQPAGAGMLRIMLYPEGEPQNGQSTSGEAIFLVVTFSQPMIS